MRVNGEGPIPSRIMLVGEAPGAEEERTGLPFVGASGQELNRMLQDAGIMRSECYATNVCKLRPPNNQLAAWIAKAKKDITPAHKQWRGKWVLPQITEGYAELLTEIEMVQPNLIIAFGNLAMLALTGNWGVLKWRGSQLKCDKPELVWTPPGTEVDAQKILDTVRPKVIPTIHPAAVLRQYELRPLVMTDLRRAKRQMTSREYADRPEWKFLVRPNFDTFVQTSMDLLIKLEAAPLWIDLDIETVGGHIDSVGMSWSRVDALCIPFMSRGNKAGYWSLEEETQIIFTMYRILTHRNARIRWQNGLFDAQYIHRHWHFIPRGAQDTMISQHSAFAALPKSLGFLGSMYAEHYIYWKDEGRISSSEPEEKRWTYNLQDCIYTREVGEELTKVLAAYGLTHVDAVQQELFYPVLHAMLRGVRVRTDIKAQLGLSINEELSKREAFLYNVLGHQINESSPKQMQALFYEDLKQKPVLKRVKQSDGSFLMRPTVDDEALTFLGRREPLLKPICNAVADIRTLDKWYKDFVMMPVDADGRMRCSFNIAGDAGDKAAETAGVKSAPYTYRLSSSKNPSGSGGNLQTIPSEKSKSSGKAAARGSMDFTLPNIRSMYGPDLGFTFFDMDLDRADMQPVAWEADDPLLKAALKMGADVHILNSFVLDNIEPPPLEELVETHPKYWDHRGPRKFKREFAKVFGHACITGDHEVLTPQGWQRVDTITDEQQIAVWDSSDEDVWFEVPKGWNRDATAPGEPLVAFEGQAFSQLTTTDHRMAYTTDDTGWRVGSADLVKDLTAARLPKSGFYSGPKSLACARLVVAFMADGSIDKYGNVSFHFHKERKKIRIRKLLEGREYSEGEHKFYVPHRSATDFTYYGKDYENWLLELDAEALDSILDEIQYWDGSKGKTGAMIYSSKHEHGLQWLRTIAHLRGKASQYQGTTVSGFGSTVHRCSINNRPKAGVASLTKRERVPSEVAVPVFCPRTTTGFFFVRRNGKISVTGNTDYLGKAKTVAEHTGRLVSEVERAQKLYFGRYPGIQKWHTRIIEQVKKHRFVENAFGYRWYIFDRIDDQLMPKAVAWIPQSTVGILINKIWINFYKNIKDVQVLLQVHDSLAGQFPTHRKALILPQILEQSRVVIPYADPLIIPVGIKTSDVSWGDCV